MKERSRQFLRLLAGVGGGVWRGSYGKPAQALSRQRNDDLEGRSGPGGLHDQ